jgi:hypothetical protein
MKKRSRYWQEEKYLSIDAGPILELRIDAGHTSHRALTAILFLGILYKI